MDPIQFMITAAGLDALVNAQGGGTDAIKISQLGISENAFVMAPTITTVPGELKRIASISGESTSETIIHMTAQDVSQDIYELRGLGLYLADGTLFAIYSQETPIFRKVSISFFLLALDISFENAVAGGITFGDTSFLLPPASETIKGVAEIATDDEADAGTDDARIISPKKLRRLLDALHVIISDETDADLTALANGFDAIIAALVARTITGSGLATGGGDLSASRVLSVLAASAADVGAGTATDRAVTPASLSGLARSLGQNGYVTLPGLGGLILQWGRFTAFANATSSAVFPISFPNACFAVVSDGGVSGGADSQDNPPVLVASSISQTGFSVFSADDSSATRIFFALGN
ncbi:gp53-like domain-containing protein [Sphingobium yanoikuyae]|uniref:Putative tail fiber protein gp53-like C-terminal domain-containing protein n=1 Tax=Sphingobium yanoikuyae TaxID=13690 RepID=A0A291N683_SPHYA|nr:hypothetical protein [Sphingobium yanoikuyae]ATI82904.1 hypothetical protein A6768_24825 [Sphingobium yanoikuyae]